jgi:DNA-binding MarR family transcriptional regulator
LTARAKTNELVTQYCALNRQLNLEYDEYAKSLGMTYSSLLVLCIIYDHPENCLQKTICEETFLPKQTVNQIITAFYKKGLIKMAEVESDRRYKTIHLTESGLAYANPKVAKIKAAENKAMDSLKQSERAALIEVTEKFFSAFRDFMKED